MTIPSRMDKRSGLLSPRDQGTEATCVAFAIAAAREALLNEPNQLAPRYLYHCCKLIDKRPNATATHLFAAVQTLRQKGVCEESIWPYERPYQFRADIASSEADANALLYRISDFTRLDQTDRQAMLTNMKRWLCEQGCVAVGIWVYDTWAKQQAVGTGMIPNLTGFERRLGGHAVCFVGYDDESQYFIFKNSWGQGWGEGGYGYLPYDYVSSSCFEAWGIQVQPDPVNA